MPVCIAGMHRSGTSMIAHLLSVGGLYLGPESDLLPAAPDNPEGFWEHVDFLQLNESILAHLKGAWDCVPPVEEGWEKHPSLLPIRNKGAALLQRFGGREPWGWKDPRNSITFPFWKSLMPDLKVVICVRNPQEVADSLRSRNGYSSPLGFHLWLAVNRGLMSAVAPEDRVITHYDSYFSDARAELRRLLERLGIPLREDTLERACATRNAALRHHRISLEDLHKSGLPDDVLTCYLEMCAEAGPVLARVVQSDLERSAVLRASMQKSESKYRAAQDLIHLHNHLSEREVTIQELTKRLEEQTAAVRILTSQATERDEQLHASAARVAAQVQQIEVLTAQAAQQEELQRSLVTELAGKEQQVAQAAAHIESRGRQVETLTAQLAQEEQSIAALVQEMTSKERESEELAAHIVSQEHRLRELQALAAEWESITASAGWALLQMLWRIRLWLAPRDSRREAWGKAFMHGWRWIKHKDSATLSGRNTHASAESHSHVGQERQAA